MVIEPKPTPDGQLKMIRTQGTGKYDNVHCGLQDKSGNLWFGTTGEGVYRYDGKYFANYTVKNGLCSNTVYAVLEDNSGNIWFGTVSGVCRYDGHAFMPVPVAVTNGGGFNPFAGNTPTLPQPEIWSMLQDKTGKIWFGTSAGVYRYDGTFFTRFLDHDGILNKNGLSLKHVSSIMEDKNGNIWFSTWFEGLCRYDGQSVTSYKPNGEVWFSTLLEDKTGKIWIGRRDKGVCFYDGTTFANVLQHGIFDSCSAGPMAEDNLGNIWFCSESGDITARETKGGVWCYNPSAAPGDLKTFTNFTVKEGLSNNSVFSITIDKSGNLWFGTRGMGLCRYDGKNFTSFSE